MVNDKSRVAGTRDDSQTGGKGASSLSVKLDTAGRDAKGTDTRSVSRKTKGAGARGRRK